MVDGVNKLVKFPDEGKISLKKSGTKPLGKSAEAASSNGDNVISDLSENGAPANIARKMENSLKLKLNEDISRHLQGENPDPAQEPASLENSWKEIQRTIYEKLGEEAQPRTQPLSSYDQALNLTQNLADRIRGAGKSSVVNELTPTTVNNLLTS